MHATTAMSYQERYFQRHHVNLRQSFRRARTVPLPMYQDSSRIWHYHVVCLTCHPDHWEAIRSSCAVPTRAEAFRLQNEENHGVHGVDAGHRHVLLGCGGIPCRIAPLMPPD